MRLEKRGFYSPSFRIPWEQLSSSLSITLNFLLRARVSPSRFTDLWIHRESDQESGLLRVCCCRRPCSKLSSLYKPSFSLSTSSPPPYLPFVEEGSPLPSQVYYFQIASEEKRGVGERWEAKEEE